MTDAATMEVVEMVLSGLVNKRIVQAINAQGGKAIGLSGKDANLMICDYTDPDLGLVGTPSEVRPEFLRSLAAAEIIPIIAPIGVGRNGETFNVNGDTAAGAIAVGTQGRPLVAADRCRRRQECRRRSADRAECRPDPADDRQTA